MLPRTPSVPFVAAAHAGTQICGWCCDCCSDDDATLLESRRIGSRARDREDTSAFLSQGLPGLGDYNPKARGWGTDLRLPGIFRM